ncbi:MAG: hypothetical protein RTU92_14285 [Candidatus Thorarchaeota archaeon]
MKLRSWFSEYRVLILVLGIGVIVWAFIYNMASIDFVADRIRPYRGMWNGNGEIPFFGSAINVYFEGYVDHDYYYISWADQFLSGYVPYTESFDRLVIERGTYNTPYFFPPLYVYICALGRILPIQPFGIGLVLCIFGYMTALPVYGIARFLSDNKRVGEVAAATYLLNPLVLYHVTFLWLNPSPFVFFAMLSFYLMMKGHRTAGVLAMVTSVLFKQTAIFLGIPVLAFVVKRAARIKNEDSHTDDEYEQLEDTESKTLLSDAVDLVGFGKTAIIAIVYFVVLSLPYILDPLNYFYQILQRAGGTYLTDLSALPKASHPIVIAHLFISFGAPAWVVEIFNVLSFSSIGLLIGILPITALMLLEVKDDSNIRGYWRKIFFLTLMLVLWLHLWSPRGIYKYYLVLLIPFLSILAVSSMCSKDATSIRVSIPMLILPFVLTILLLFPHRTVYFLFLVLITISYPFHRYFGEIYRALKYGANELVGFIEDIVG